MPKTLLLLRHAKSSWADDTLNDFDRPLNERGRKAAPLMGAYLRQHRLIPNFILCSSARRTRETLDLLISGMGEAPEARLTTTLYHAAPRDMRDVIETAPEECERLLVIGHNPGIHALAFDLMDARASEPTAHARLDEKFPTAALAVFAFNSEDWSLPLGTGFLGRFVRPKDLSEG